MGRGERPEEERLREARREKSGNGARARAQRTDEHRATPRASHARTAHMRARAPCADPLGAPAAQ
eukprot:6011199-Alexandrium_andersonii.AAC.1